MPTLETVPLEVLFRIFDFVANPFDSILYKYHPFNSIAATSRHFDSASEEYARALLKQHANFALKRRSKTYTSRRKWLAETCQLCYKKSKRRSTFWRHLTCCQACDNHHFDKVTMTNAIKRYNLSKLDLFTPNRLHPTLPPLAHGEYSVMGTLATMIYKPDLILRQNHVHFSIDSINRGDAQLRKRIRRHDMLLAHMSIAYSTAQKRWWRTSLLQEEGNKKPVKASMETEESREAFVQQGLAFERDLMNIEGASEDNAIKVD